MIETHAKQEGLIKEFSSTLFYEIETRNQAERELKCMIEVTSKDMIIELKQQQDKIDSVIIRLKNTEYELNQSILEKIDMVSKCIETETYKINTALELNYNNCKDRITELTESMKKNIINNEKWKNSYLESAKNTANLISQLQKNSKVHSKGYENVYEKLRKLQKYVEARMVSNCKILEKRIDSLSFEMQKCLDSTDFNLTQNQLTITEALTKLDQKICEIDSIHSQEIEEINNSLNFFDDEVKYLQDSETNYYELIARLETQIDLKLTNEKVTREHMVNFFQSEIFANIKTLKKSQKNFGLEIEKLLSVAKKNTEGYEDLCQGFEIFRKNIKSEIEESLENNPIKEKIEIGEALLEELKEKIFELQEESTKMKLVLKHNKTNDSKYVKESYNVLNDLTNRVETMDILKKLNLIFVEMDSNEKETQAMLEVYKKELEFIQEKQQKGLEDAQAAVYEIFAKKISGLQDMLVTEMEKVIQLANDNRPSDINLSGLQEMARKLKK